MPWFKALRHDIDGKIIKEIEFESQDYDHAYNEANQGLIEVGHWAEVIWIRPGENDDS
jgi:hypothetical protein